MGVGDINIRVRRPSVAGANTQVIFNKGGVEGASPNLTFDGANLVVNGLNLLTAANSDGTLLNGAVVQPNTSNINYNSTTSVIAAVTANGVTNTNVSFSVNTTMNLTSLNVTANISNTGNILVSQNVITGNITVVQNVATGNLNVSSTSFEGNLNVYFTANVTNGNIIANSYQFNAPTSLTVPLAGTVANVGTEYVKNVANAILIYSTFPMANNTKYNSDIPGQTHLGYRNIYRVMPSALTSTVNTSCFFTDGLSMNVTANAVASLFPTNANPIMKSSMRRLQLNANSTLLGNANAIFCCNANAVWTGNGSGSGNGGGFLYITVFSVDSFANTNTSFFAGMSNISAASLGITSNADPISNTIFNHFGVGANINTGSLKVIFGAAGAARVTTDLGANFTLNTNDVYEVTIFAPPSGATIGARVRNLTNGAESTVISATTPTTNSFIQPVCFIQGNCSSTGTALATLNAQISIMRMYLETLY